MGKIEEHVAVDDGYGTCEHCPLPVGHPTHLDPVPPVRPPEHRARTTDPSTSHAAAASLSEETLRDSQRAVLAWLREHGPATDEELVMWGQDTLRQSPSGLRTRRAELTDAGLVVDTGRRRPLSSGRNGIVWEAPR